MFRSSGFTASGLVVHNCTKSVEEGAIIIESNSRVMFEDTIFRGNQKRAIYVASHTSLALKSCYFEKNGNHDDYGGAIRVLNNASLSINSSSFNGTSDDRSMDSSWDLFCNLQCVMCFVGNTARDGGAISGDGNISLIILSSDFSSESFVIKILKSLTLFRHWKSLGNQARSVGGAIFIKKSINLSLINTTLLGDFFAT